MNLTPIVPGRRTKLSAIAAQHAAMTHPVNASKRVPVDENNGKSRERKYMPVL